MKNFIVFWFEIKFIIGLNDYNIFKGKNKNNVNKGLKKIFDNYFFFDLKKNKYEIGFWSSLEYYLLIMVFI